MHALNGFNDLKFGMKFRVKTTRQAILNLSILVRFFLETISPVAVFKSFSIVDSSFQNQEKANENSF